MVISLTNAMEFYQALFFQNSRNTKISPIDWASYEVPLKSVCMESITLLFISSN